MNVNAYAPEFHSFLTSVNAGFLNPSTPALFETALRAMPLGGAILEIGSCCGLSLNAISYIARQLGRQEAIFSCDPWPFPKGPIAGTDIDKHAYRDFVVETFKRNVAFFSRQNLPHPVEASADNFFVAWRDAAVIEDMFGYLVRLGGPLGFAFIDGWHQYEAVANDFANVDRHLMQGGLILFDDSGDDGIYPDVNRCVHEALADGRYELIEKNPNYLVRKL